MHHLAKSLRESASTFRERPFLNYLEGEDIVSVAYGEFAGQAQDWAVFLKSRGVAPGDRVGIITPKCPHQMRAFYACWWSGFISVPIGEALGDLEMGFIIRDSEPKLILVDGTMREKVCANSGDIPVVSFSELPSGSGQHACVPIEEVAEDDAAALIYTSGSTGMPKGVVLTHKNFCVNAASALAAVHITPDDSVMSLLPYWHSFALVVEVIASVQAGCTVIIPKGKLDFRHNIRRYQPTIILLVPRIADALKRGITKRIDEGPERVRAIFDKAIHNASRIFTAGPRIDGGILRMLTHHTFFDPVVFRKIRKAFGGRVRFFVSGGAPIDIEHEIFFKYIGAPIFQGYGLTEATPAISTNYPEVHRLGSCGKVLPWLRPENGGDYTFKDEQGNLGKGLRGELLVKGDCVMKGYWRHTDASSKTLSEGWLHTGDIGYVDDDGFLFLDGRRGNMIVLVGGEKLHPEHVEDIVKTSDWVTEAMVIGEKCKNVYACVNVDAGLAAGLDESELTARVRGEVMSTTEHLAAYQRPKDVLILPELSVEEATLTVTLKIRRHMVWQKYGDMINAFLRDAGEVTATRKGIGIESSRVMATLGRGADASRGAGAPPGEE